MPHWFGCFAEKRQYLNIRSIHYKALIVVYNSNRNYDELLRDNNEIAVHQTHLRYVL